jgi:hypothetical protein
MDEPRPSITPYHPCGPIGADAAPKTLDVSCPTDPLPESSMIVYCDNEQEVREGFAVALRAMGVGANLSIAVIVPSAASSTRENN